LMMTNHRLLYRGALELPDSYMVLDGLSFTLTLDSVLSTSGERGNSTVTSTPSGKSKLDLLENPLALALESMRGRPTLRFLGTTRIADVHVDGSFNANVYIHPSSTLTQFYFGNLFCSSPINVESNRTEYGVRVGLGDQDVQGSSEILIYGHLPPAQPESQVPVPPTTPPGLSLVARRVVPVPLIPPPLMRLPRPDDPTPRKPPLVIFGKKTGESQRTGGSKLKEPEMEDPPLKRGKEIKGLPPKAGSTKGLGRGTSFRVPDDVFGSTPLVTPTLSAKGKGKGKIEGLSNEQFETLNKAEVKKICSKVLVEIWYLKRRSEL